MSKNIISFMCFTYKNLLTKADSEIYLLMNFIENFEMR